MSETCVCGHAEISHDDEGECWKFNGVRGCDCWKFTPAAPAVPVGVNFADAKSVQPAAEERSACGDNVCTNLGCTDACGLAVPVVQPEPGDRAEVEQFIHEVLELTVPQEIQDVGLRQVKDVVAVAQWAAPAFVAAVAAVRADLAADVAELATIEEDTTWGKRTAADMREAVLRLIEASS